MNSHKYDRYPTYRTLAPPKKGPSSSGPGPSKFLIYAVAVALLALIFRVGLWIHDANHAAALETAAHQKALIATETKDINSAIASNPAISYSVSVNQPSGGLSQHFGIDGPMEAASVGKLITASLFLHRCEEGLDNLGEQLDGVSVRTLIRQMVNQSDDNAWATLNDYLGHPSLSRYGKLIGMSSYNPDTNWLSTDDMSLLLSKLTQGSLLNSVDTNFLLSSMEHTNYEDIITPAIPSGATIYHKVGEIDDNVNDAAIVTQGSKKVVIVIFTDGHGTQDWAARAATIQQISKAVFEAFLATK